MNKLKQISIQSLLLFLLLYTNLFSYGSVKGDYRSNAITGNWSQSSSWEVFDGVAWSVAASIPSSTSNVLIKANNKISIDTTANCKYLSFTNNTGNSQIDFNVASGELSIYGDAEFRDGVNSVHSWTPGAKLVFRGVDNQIITTGIGTRFYEIEINKQGGVVTQAGGSAVKIEKSLLITGEGSFVLGNTTNLEGVQFTDGATPTAPSITIDSSATMQIAGNSIVRSGSTGAVPIGSVRINGILNLISASPTGINFGDVILGDGFKTATLNITGDWVTGTFYFSSLTVNDHGLYLLSATSIGNSGYGTVLFNPGSKVIYQNGASANLPFADVNYYDLTIGITTSWNMAGNRTIYGNMIVNGACALTITGSPGITADLKLLSVKGNLNIENTAILKIKHTNIILDGDLVLKNGAFEGGNASSSSINSALYNFNGNVIIDNGSIKLTTTDSDPVYNVKGNIYINNGGTFVGTTDPDGIPTLNIQGGITTSPGSIFKATDISSPNKSTLFNINFSNESGYNTKSELSVSSGLTTIEALWRFTISPGRTIHLKSDIELGGDTLKTTFSSFEVKGTGVLNTDTFRIKGTPFANDTRFILSSNSLLQIGCSEGISTYPSLTGAIQTISRKFLSAANYSYTGNLNQNTGNGLPSLIKNLTISNTGSSGNNTVTLTNNALSISSDTCTITSGIFDVGNNTFSGSNGNLIMTGGELKISKISNTTLLPELTGVYNLTGGTIELNGNGSQVIRGTNTYYNLKFSGTNVYGVSYKNPSSTMTINDNLEITDNAILDAIDVSGNAVSIQGPGGLTMSGNSRFRMKKLNATLPELTATNPGADYVLSGGTIELYGTDSTQTHSLNGTKGMGSDIRYHNVVLNARALNQTDANIVLQSSIYIDNDFIINAPASFQISNTYSLKGTGNFDLKPGATLQYGSPDGISKLPNVGNIRVSGTRKLSGSANYGFIGGVEMVSGNLLPDTVNNLFINKTNGTKCVLSQSLKIKRDLHFRNGNINSTTINVLIIQAGATVTGASSTSYVAGPVMKMGNSAFKFPIGKNGYYRPAAISAPATIFDAFTGEYFMGNPTSVFGTMKDSIIDHISKCEYWMLNRTTGTSNAAVTLMYDDNSCGVNSLSDLRVVKWDGQKWNNLGNSGFASVSSSSGYVISNQVSSFSPFTLASSSSSNPLPISLLVFNAQYIFDKVELRWVTAQEFNNDYFTLERSTDGINFESIAIVKGAGISSQMNHYLYTDLDPLSGVIYYRLKQTDFNGDFIYTDSIGVIIKEKNSFFIKSIYTKEDILYLSINDPLNTLKRTTIFDVIGRELYSIESSDNNLELPLFNFSKDYLYLIRISNGHEELVRKLFY